MHRYFIAFGVCSMLILINIAENSRFSLPFINWWYGIIGSLITSRHRYIWFKGTHLQLTSFDRPNMCQKLYILKITFWTFSQEIFLFGIVWKKMPHTLRHCFSFLQYIFNPKACSETICTYTHSYYFCNYSKILNVWILLFIKFSIYKFSKK